MKYKLLPRMLFFFIVVMLGGIIFELVGINYIVSETKKSVELIYAETQLGIIDNIYDRELESMELLLFDYTVWDDLYHSMQTEDYEWAYDNATGFLVDDDSYNIDAVYVKSSVSKFFEFYGHQQMKTLIESSDLYQKLISTNTHVKDFVMMDGEAYLMVGSPIRTSDERLMNGYYIMVRKISDVYVHERVLSYLSVDEYLGVNNIFVNEEKNLKRINEIELDYPIYNAKGQQIESFAFHFDMTRYHQSYNDLFYHTSFMVAVTGMVILLGILLVAHRVHNVVEVTIRQVDRVAKGDYEYQIGIVNNYELNEVITHVNNMGTQINDKINKIKENHFETLSVLINAIEEKDPYTRGHSERVKDISLLLAKNYKGVNLELLEEAALLHDIGKIGIPEEILNKPGRLSSEEFDVIKTHPEKGERILLSSSRLQNVAKIVRQHHERMDGNGYPDALEGDQIELEARIIAVADAFDAMTSKRSYRNEMTFEKGSQILLENSGTQFDEDVVVLFISNQDLIRQLGNESS